MKTHVYARIVGMVAWAQVLGVVSADWPVELISRAVRPSISAEGDSFASVLSGDGKWVVFQGRGRNLHAADREGDFSDVFVQEVSTGRRELVSVNTNGVSGNGASEVSGISRNGRYVLFVSEASDLVVGDENEATDVFVRDRLSQVTRLVSSTPDGTSGNGNSGLPVMTPDGRWVAFESEADNLVDGDTNEVVDIYLRDTETGTTRRITVPSPIASVRSRPAGDSTGVLLSEDGGTLVYRSDGLNLAPTIRAGALTLTNDLYVMRSPAETNRMVNVFEGSVASPVDLNSVSYSLSDDGRYVALLLGSSRPTLIRTGIYRLDLDAGVFDRVSEGLAGGADTGTQELLSPVISADGQTVIFEWFSSTFPTGGVSDPVVYVWNSTSRVPERVSSGGWVTNLVGEASESPSGSFLAASPDARFVAFLGGSTNDPPGFPSGQLVVRDRSTGELRRISRTWTGGAIRDVSYPFVHFSDDGKRLTFQCGDDQLVAEDRNNGWDVFLYDWDTDRLSLVSFHAADLPSRTPYGSVYTSPGALSADGRYVVYTSSGQGFGSSGGEGLRQVFRFDRRLETNVLVSVRPDGVSEGNGSSENGIISRDGRFVVFTSVADDLLVGDTNRTQDLFLRDMDLGTTQLVSRRPDGGVPSGASSNPVLSSDGRWVAFESLAADLSPLDTGRGASTSDVFLFDRLEGKVALVSVAETGGTSGNGASGQPAFSPDDRWLVFESRASNLIHPAPGTGRSVYARNLQSGDLRRIAMPETVSLNRFPGPSPVANFSPEGRFATVLMAKSVTEFELLLHDFETGSTTQVVPSSLGASLSQDALRVVYATGLSATNGVQIRLLDRTAGVDSLVSAAPDGVAGDGSSDAPPLISPDGRWVVFSSGSRNLTPLDDNGYTDVFVKDLATGEMTRLGGNLLTAHPALSADGTTLLFRSFASDWIDGDYNGNSDLFVARLVPSGPPASVLSWARAREGTLRLTWAAQSGKVYRLMTASRIGGPWSASDAAVANDGMQHSVEVTLGIGTDAAFYRLEVR